MNLLYEGDKYVQSTDIRLDETTAVRTVNTIVQKLSLQSDHSLMMQLTPENRR